VELTTGRVLVTGADGFIGSHLAEALVQHGAQVRALVQYNSFNSWGWLDTIEPSVRERMEVISGDIRDPHFTLSLVEGCSTVFHLAALIAIPFSYAAPDYFADVNLKGTLNVLQAARRAAVARFIQTSTSEVYGTARFVPITEEHPLQAQSPYAASKIAADQMALSFHKSFGLPVAVCRPCNTYGPRQSARAVIPSIIIQLLQGHRRIRLGATRPTRDFNFVSDTVAGFIAIARADVAVGEVINIGSNFEVSIGETFRMIADEMDVPADIVTDSARLRPQASEVDRLWADNSKAARLTGWAAQYAGRDGFRRGLRATIDWFRQPANVARYKAELYNT
jgi:NAD dependent epimerase/dehydratase